MFVENYLGVNMNIYKCADIIEKLELGNDIYKKAIHY